MSDRSQIRELFKFLGFIILAIVLGVGFFYRGEIIPYVKDIVLGKPAPEHKEVTAQDTSKQAEKKKERKILYWTDPMIPGFKPAPEHKEVTAQDTSKQGEGINARKRPVGAEALSPGLGNQRPGKSPMNM